MCTVLLTAGLAGALRFSQADSAGALADPGGCAWRARCSVKAVRRSRRRTAMALKAIVATLILGTSSLALAGPFQREARAEQRERGDRMELRHARNELRRAARFGASRREIRHERGEIRRDRRALGRGRWSARRDRWAARR